MLILFNFFFVSPPSFFPTFFLSQIRNKHLQQESTLLPPLPSSNPSSSSCSFPSPTSFLIPPHSSPKAMIEAGHREETVGKIHRKEKDKVKEEKGNSWFVCRRESG